MGTYNEDQIVNKAATIVSVIVIGTIVSFVLAAIVYRIVS